MKVKISSRWMRHKFNCTEAFILNNCHGRCCEGTGKVVVSLLPEEEAWHRSQGLVVIEGRLWARAGKCPHKETSGFCSIHGTQKPFGCIASPFTLNRAGTLIIRHRYSRLKCHGEGEAAYRTFRASLVLLFGPVKMAIITTHLDKGSDDFIVNMDDDIAEKVRYLDSVKAGG